MTSQKKFAGIGSVSSGTMREEDLVPTFLDVLQDLDKAKHDEIMEEYKDVLDNDDVDEESDEYHEGMQYCCEALFDALNDYAPPYAHFGAHEGDGADYGFWVSWDSLDDDVKFGEVLRCNELPDDFGEADYALVISDHGNATLYGKDGKEIWGVV